MVLLSMITNHNSTCIFIIILYLCYVLLLLLITIIITARAAHDEALGAAAPALAVPAGLVIII